MEPFPSLEDERGVDISQIRALLRLSVAERVAEMVHAANVLMSIPATARASMQRDDLDIVTDFGGMHLTVVPAGDVGDDAWSSTSEVVVIGGREMVRIAALDDVIKSKRAANRPKDQLALPYLESLREQIAKMGDDAS